MSQQEFDFDKLIFPIKTNVFFSDYWEQQPLIVTREERDYYSQILSIKQIESLIYSRRRDATQIRVINQSQSYFQNSTSQINSDNIFGINEIYNAYYQGNTITLNQLQYSCEPIAILCRNLEKLFHFQVNASIYLTPKQAQGIVPHYDTHDVFILQIEGSKIWHIYDYFCCLPLAKDRQPVPADQLPPRLHEVCLNAGDLIYIPRGYVHEALTSESSSLHLTIAIHPLRLSDLITSAINLASKDCVSLRKSLPIGFFNNKEQVGILTHQFKELLDKITTEINIEDVIDDLAEDLLAKLEPLPDGHFAQIDRLQNLDINSILRKRDGIICHILKKGDSVSIYFPGNHVSAPSFIEPALRFIAETEEFYVNSIPGNISDESKLVLARRLVKEGLLTIVH
ncbi:MAG: cupin domain-containing protein [Nostoc sp.]|uniref:cupin domain-containing protein n=1 Tax=Nostoc sp. TaxID=1180 RepID=UPI002FFB84B3